MVSSTKRFSPPIQNIVFDFGGVLANFDYGIVYRRFAQKSPLTVSEIHERLYYSSTHLDFEGGRITGREFYRQVVEVIHLRMDYETFFEAWADIFWPIEPMLDLAEELGRRYELFLLSNTNEIHYTEFPKIPRLSDLIPRQGVSHLLKVMKPDVRIYQRFLDKFTLRAKECLFIDDMQVNVDGAKEAGLRAIRHKDVDSTRAELAKLGILDS